MRLKHLLYAIPLGLLIGCGSESAAPPKVADQLTAAKSYLNTALPNFGNAVGRNVSAGGRAIQFITPAVWSSTTVGNMVDPPGGVVSNPAEEPTYGGATLPTKVNYRDFMKMALDADYQRRSGDGRNFRPTVFGRFDNVLNLFTYMTNAGIVTDASGMIALGDYNSTLTIDGSTLRIIAKVTAATATTYYDRLIDVYGFADTNGNQALDTGETKMFHNLMWMRSDASTLNFMMGELGDRNSDGTPDTTSLSILRWNIGTGNFQFEYVSNPDDSVSNSTLEIFRAHIEATGGKVYLYGYSGKADAGASPGEYTQYALYTPTTATTEGTVSLREVRNNADVWQGNVCSTFTTGVATAGETAGEAEPASGGTCAGQAADAINTKAGIMGFANSIRADVSWKETADDKGFPATANPNWTTDAARLAWQTAGQSISASFSDRTSFIAQWDATP